MQKIIKNTLLKYIPDNLQIESEVNQKRIFDINNFEIKKGEIIYLCEKALRFKDNFALQFALEKSKVLSLNFKIIYPKLNFEVYSKNNFIQNQIKIVKKGFDSLNIEFIETNNPYNYLIKNKIGLLILDFNPILNRNWVKNLNYKIYEIDSNNIIPARFISDKQEYNAFTFRKKVYLNIYNFLTEYKNIINTKTEADYKLEDFINNKLFKYEEFKNNPFDSCLSGMSKYLNLGFISSQRIAIEVIKSKVSDLNKESFLEELIVRKELADNFCLYSKDFKSINSAPNWAKESLSIHKNDIRDYIYSLKEFEFAETHDELWNLTQKQLTERGIIHGYLRMYWAKKILEWTDNPEEALKFAIYLNDKYAYDSPSANGYVNILWSICGLHDRAFQDWKITGKIRRMNCTKIKRFLKENNKNGL